MNTTFYCVPKSKDLMHYGVKGMKWGVRKAPQASLIGRRQNAQMTEQQLSQRKAQRRARVKKAAIIGGSVVAVGLAAYGVYKYSSLKKEMRTLNSSISLGQRMVENLRVRDRGTYNPMTKGSVTYWGNDFKQHTATKEWDPEPGVISSYRNYGANTQRTYNSVRDFARAKKRYTGRY